MATYTLGSWSTSPDTTAVKSIDDRLPGRRGLSPRRPLVALAVVTLVAAGFVVFSADAAGEEVAPGELQLTSHKPSHSGGGGNCVDTGAGDECDNSPAGSGGAGCDHGLGDKKKDNGADCGNPSDVGDDDDLGDDDDDDGVGGDDDDDGVGDDDDSTGGNGGNGSTGGDTTGDDDDTTGPQVLGVVEENNPDPSRPHARGGTDGTGTATPDELAFTGLGGVVQLAMSGSSLMAAGLAMIFGGRRKRFGA